MNTDRIAVVIEDDADVGEVIEAILVQAGFNVKLASTGAEGIELVRVHAPTLTTLDVNMPGMDGFETLKRIRHITASSIIMISACFDEVDVVRGLSAGADDFVAKPFRIGELRARIDAVLRRASTVAELHPATSTPTSFENTPQRESSGWLHHDGLRLDKARRIVEVDGAPVMLTRSEFDLLAQLLQPANQAHSKTNLIHEIRSDNYRSGLLTHADKRSLEVHVANLRKKIGPANRIETVRGVGYRLANGPF
ncbi:response regulator transcription factor [Cryobacterium melibiosiphilum]|uniref:response regulator transcription factor n=1 Tax=Cryobacterium melibiosiphilum TaxID=995039 RepID=UPI0018F79FDF|nr:response regulator transcription factor [Cryobacterium melibiosiphilum]